MHRIRYKINDWLGAATLHNWTPFWLVKLILNIQIRYFKDCVENPNGRLR